MIAVHRVTELALPSPLHAYVDAFPRRAGTFLLDGAGGPPGLAAFALFGAEPVARFRARRTDARTEGGALVAEVTITRDGDRRVVRTGDVFAALRAFAEEHAVPDETFASSPLPFRAGLVGWIGYEVGQMLERLPCRPRARDAELPDLAFDLHDWVLGAERATGRVFLSVVGRGATKRAAEAAADATTRRLEAILGSARSTPRIETPETSATAEAIGARAALSREAYEDAVRRAREHIEEGDAFEICVTNAFDVPFGGDAFALWKELRRANACPFAAFLDFPEAAIVSSSPERFLTLDARRVAESRPIKGTRPRGDGELEDARLAHELATSGKDRAENTMIVDLARNDLGRVCRFGSVHVPELCVVERHPTVHQMVSTVRGELDGGKDAFDLVRVCFPPGSMTGAPKIEAMTILEGLEPAERGVYAGALGWIDLAGTLDLSVVIRTAVVRDGNARVGAGGAVVADSSPEAEHEEMLLKTRAVFEAIARTRPPGEAP